MQRRCETLREYDRCFLPASRRDLCHRLRVACFLRNRPSPSITLHTSPSPRADQTPSTHCYYHPFIHTSPPRGKRARACARARAHDLTLTEQLPTFASLQPQPYPTSPYLSPFLTFFDLPLCICIYTHIPASDGLFAHFSLYLASHANTRKHTPAHSITLSKSRFLFLLRLTPPQPSSSLTRNPSSRSHLVSATPHPPSRFTTTILTRSLTRAA